MEFDCEVTEENISSFFLSNRHTFCICRINKIKLDSAGIVLGCILSPLKTIGQIKPKLDGIVLGR
jgi:hypothetical protein